VIGDEEIRGKMNRMRIEERVDLDHHSIEVWIKEERQEGGRSGEGIDAEEGYEIRKVGRCLKES